MKIFTLFAFLALSANAFSIRIHDNMNLNRILNKIVIHTPGGNGIHDDIDGVTEVEFIAATDGVAYFTLKGLGHGYSRLTDSNIVFNPEKHWFALVSNDTDFDSMGWEFVESRGFFSLYMRQRKSDL